MGWLAGTCRQQASHCSSACPKIKRDLVECAAVGLQPMRNRSARAQHTQTRLIGVAEDTLQDIM